MIKNYKASKIVVSIEYCLEFVDDLGNGFSFPCDQNENVILQPEAQENYNDCISGKYPELHRKFIRYENKYREPATGICSCGKEIQLVDEYMGTCGCDCGRYYNMFGQELISPEFWEED